MKLNFFIKPLVWLALMCYGLFTPPGKLPGKGLLSFPHFDKIVHFGLFFIFCMLLFRPFKKLKMNQLFLAPAIALFFAATLEFMQTWITSSRNSNIFDFYANTAGIIVAVIVYSRLISGTKFEKFL